MDQHADSAFRPVSHSMGSVAEVDPGRHGSKSAAHRQARGFSRNDLRIHAVLCQPKTESCGVRGFRNGRAKRIRVSVDAR
jgi:hypothetical protein